MIVEPIVMRRFRASFPINHPPYQVFFPTKHPPCQVSTFVQLTWLARRPRASDYELPISGAAEKVKAGQVATNHAEGGGMLGKAGTGGEAGTGGRRQGVGGPGRES